MAYSRHCSMFGRAFGLKNSKGLQSKEQDYRKICSPHDFHLPTHEKFAPPYAFSKSSAKSLKRWVMGASTLDSRVP